MLTPTNQGSIFFMRFVTIRGNIPNCDKQQGGGEGTLAAASAETSHLFILLGGSLLENSRPPRSAGRLANAMHDKSKIDRIAPGHCTGDGSVADNLIT